MRRRDVLTAIVAVIVAAAAAQVAGGPVAGAVMAAYGGAGLVLAHGRAKARRFSSDRAAAVETVSTLAAELRAGLPVPVAVATARTDLGDPVPPGGVAVVGRLMSAVELAELSGAPLADVLDRLEIHLRAMERARLTAQAQAAGARASAGLLAVLPVGGVALGYAVGADPLAMMVHTRLGAACVAAAVLLQFTGLAWSARISRVEVPA